MALPLITGRRGQSILEYLLVISLVVAALVAVRVRVRDATKKIMENAAAHVENAATITALPGGSSGGVPPGDSCPCFSSNPADIPPCCPF